MFCISCGEKQLESAKFCHNCGAKVELQASQGSLIKEDMSNKVINGDVIVNTVKKKELNGILTVSFVISILCYFLNFILGWFAVFSFLGCIVGLRKYSKEKHRGKWMGVTGIVISTIDILIYLRDFGYLDFLM